jgi:hypothetical protein
MLMNAEHTEDDKNDTVKTFLFIAMFPRGFYGAIFL